MEIDGVEFTNKIQDIKHDGENYYVNINGKWHYIYHHVFVQIPGVGQITDIIRSADRTIYIQDGKFYRFEYANMRNMTANMTEQAFGGYDIYRIFLYGHRPYYAVRIADGVQLLDQNYARIRF